MLQLRFLTSENHQLVLKPIKKRLENRTIALSAQSVNVHLSKVKCFREAISYLFTIKTVSFCFPLFSFSKVEIRTAFVWFIS